MNILGRETWGSYNFLYAPTLKVLITEFGKQPSSLVPCTEVLGRWLMMEPTNSKTNMAMKKITKPSSGWFSSQSMLVNSGGVAIKQILGEQLKTSLPTLATP